MEETMVEKKVQEFDDKEYFLYDTISNGEIKYNIFALVSDPREILVAKEVLKDGESYYQIVVEDEFDKVMKLYYERESNNI